MVGDLAPAAQQLVEIARALAVGCRVLVLDEPTSSLGQSDVRALFDVIGRLKARGIAIVYISHFIEEVQSVSDRFVVLRDGRNAGAGVSAAASAADIVGLMIGRPLDDLYPRRVRRPGEPVLQLDGVVSGRSTRGPSRSVTTDHSTRESSSSLTTSGATLTLRRGEVLGIAGLLGAGRTRLLRAIFGLEPVMRGAVRVGAFSGAATPHERWRQGVGLLSEERAGEGLALGLTLADNMTLTRLEGFGPLCTVLPARQERAVARLIDRLGIRCAGARQPAGELSGGNQQKVAVARLLHHGVDVFVLDEPTRGIDVASKAQIYTLVDELVAQQKAVLLVSSYFPELLGVCDRIAVMSRGEVGPARPVEEWTEHSLLMAASGARAAS
jgi:ribose transport system ATP-binding protein